MQTVIETKPYLAAAAAAGMSETERERTVLFLAENPQAGDLMKETGGCRKAVSPKTEKARAVAIG
jgi:hypothetical protein